MYKLDTTAALAWVEQWFLVRCLAMAYPTCIQIVETLFPFVVSRVIHYVGERAWVRMVTEMAVRSLHCEIRLGSTVMLD